jgi:hypothetical protein
MDFKCIDTLKHPLPVVWATMRDRLPEIAAMQDDIEYVKVQKRTKKDTRSVHVISSWKTDPPLPAFLKGFIKPDMLIWTDDAVWENDSTTCHFNIITNYQVEDIHCIGTIKFEEAAKGKSTRITYSGVLTIKKTARSSIFMTGFIIKGIEAVASHLIEHNFAKVVKTLDETIKAEK